MKNNWLFALVLLAIALFVSGCSKTETKGAAGALPLVVGMELAYPPFETKNAQDEPSGVSVDLAKDLGAYLNRPVTIVNTNWDGLIPSLQTGKVDVVISSMTITEQRAEVVDFSNPYAHSYLALLVNKEANITSVDDLNKEGVVVDVKKGTTGYVYAKKYLTNAQVNALSSENACVTEVVQGRSDAFIYDQLTIYRQNQANPKVTDAILIPFQDSENWGMAVKKGNTTLLNSINAFIEDYRKNGGFEKLTEKYLAEEKKTFDALDFPWFFTMEDK
ncbi:periplasmic component of amino acid ABC-type transporter/signal transduction system [Sphaerochaeta pleomorpha str. Grapes]|uniref:Periplasmic component of amino acid ABC-type transporter/signal transduction system n=1 Tax=Sphaerochaeta pleomorpha (strain ATCC BAA-1885 / DSM 22778 / Grapes) TaxID=158190 RepID=G8QTQ8_SPHPG|nr:transporter substrate-binding domain-containing protein [Sphaerochaeta pleomorpha]AEV28023.1 periplasmic component of amino acid ABC-type transporter/signal transduction system [Sphaerochaeta pleomorpha str. Grapes]